MKKKILIICDNNLERAPRFITQVEALKKNYELIAVSSWPNPINNVYLVHLYVHSDINPIIKFHFGLWKYFRIWFSLFNKLILIFSMAYNYILKRFILHKNFNRLKMEEFDLIINHHFDTLELATKLKKFKNSKLIFNAHEYYPLEFDADEGWMAHSHFKVTSIGKKFLPDVDLCFCVGEEISKKYLKEFGLKSVIIPNCKAYQHLEPRPTGKKIRLVHHGAAIRERRIESMIHMMGFLNSDFSLDLILVPGDYEYILELKNMARSFENIFFRKPVELNDISCMLNDYDIGVFLLDDRNFNYKYALPNKFFEFIQGRLAIAIGPSIEMESLVNKYSLGVVAADFEPETLAVELLKLNSTNIDDFKANVHVAAGILTTESNDLLINNFVNKLIK